MGFSIILIHKNINLNFANIMGFLDEEENEHIIYVFNEIYQIVKIDLSKG
jgi:hypothetical protein